MSIRSSDPPLPSDERRADIFEIQTAERRRARAASRYQPKQIDLLLIAESPPTELDRYFYFENVSRADFLFRAVVFDLLGKNPSRANKARQLAALQARGVFLIDLRPDPFDQRSGDSLADDLVKRVGVLAPKRVMLIKVNVYDALYRKLKEAGLPVIDARLPFPSTGRQREFCAVLAQGLPTKYAALRAPRKSKLSPRQVKEGAAPAATGAASEISGRTGPRSSARNTSRKLRELSRALSERDTCALAHEVR